MNSGKTTYLKKIIDDFRNNNTDVSGLLSLGDFYPDGFKRYFLYDIQSKEKRLLADREAFPESEIFGRFYFSNDTFMWGNCILTSLAEARGLVIVDEAGFLELNDRGFHKGICALLKIPPEKLIITIRENLLNELIKKYKISNFTLLNTGDDLPTIK